MLNKIVIEVIPHDKQRYPTVGDWYRDENNDLVIKVSDLGDRRYEALVAIHELVEVLLCDEANIDQKVVDDFDMAYEKNRLPSDKSEPGDDPKAPYYFQHQYASLIERMLSAYFKVDWEKYADAVEKVL